MAQSESHVHATCISVAGRGVLLRGPSGSGKSDLALRIISTEFRHLGKTVRAELVADDQVMISVRSGRVYARGPVAIRDRIEVRGIGIVPVVCVDEAEVVLVVDLVAGGAIERLPGAGEWVDVAGCRLPLLRLAPFEAAAPVKLLLGLVYAGRPLEGRA